MKVKAKFFLLLLFLSSGLFAQKELRKVSVDSGIVFLGFYTGGATMGIAGYCDHIDSMPNVTKKSISKPYLDSLSLILSNIKAQRHYQQKIGPAKYTRIFIDGKPRKLVFFKGWAILEYTDRRVYQFVLRGTQYEKILNRFIENNWN